MTVITYSSVTDLIAQEILPALGEWVQDHDVDAIVADLREQDHIRWFSTGDDKFARHGLILDVEVEEFWRVVRRHDVSGRR